MFRYDIPIIYEYLSSVKIKESWMTKNKSYHHGSLRASLIKTGLELVSEKGISGFTLRGVAKRAGVSTAAPYHHFKNKAELLEAMAAQGWHIMGAEFQTAYAAEDTPVAKLIATGVAYITFALEHTAYFRVMSRPDLYCTEDGMDHSMTGLDVFEMLNAAVINCYPEKDSDDPFIKEKVLNSWVMVHGFATLWIDGSIRSTYLGKLGVDKLMKMLFNTPIF